MHYGGSEISQQQQASLAGWLLCSRITCYCGRGASDMRELTVVLFAF